MGLSARLVAVAACAGTGLAVVSGAAGWGTAHQVLAAIAVPPLAALAFSSRKLLVPGLIAWALFGVAAAVTTPAAHLAFATIAFAATVYVASFAFRGPAVANGPARDYITLTKPRIMSLLLITGGAGYFVSGRTSFAPFAFTVVGLALACGGASALNHYLDRDIDKLMGKRTETRPVASGRVPAERALEFGLALSAASFVLLDSLVNLPTALLALAGNLFYVVVYTGYLKRSTDQNIVIGGAAGAVPPLVGYAAATGSLALPAVWLFLIVFLWTPPHFWALALMIKEHYSAANVPMLPGTRGDGETRRQILLYSLGLVAFTLVVGFWLGPLYTIAAAGLGAYFLLLAWRLRRDATRRDAVVLFHYSLAYLALLFVAAAIDPLIL